MNDTRKMVLTLFIVALVCAVVLSFVYAFTSPRIKETKKKLSLEGLRQVIEAREFKNIIPDTLWQAFDSAGNRVGIVYRVFPRGYGGPIPITVGLGPDGKITGIKIASAAEGLKETPGLGVKTTEPEFTGQFIGKCGNDVLLKKDGGTIDGITAATISSRAVCNGIKQGIDTYSKYLGPTYDKKKLFPGAKSFSPIIKDTLWYALSDTDTLGIVFIGATSGYLDTIKFIVGLNKKKKITGVDILYINESAGFGDKIKDQNFLNKFKKGMPEAITGATISSKALINGVKNGIKRFKEYLK